MSLCRQPYLRKVGLYHKNDEGLRCMIIQMCPMSFYDF
jgi:hypothetical protein